MEILISELCERLSEVKTARLVSLVLVAGAEISMRTNYSAKLQRDCPNKVSTSQSDQFWLFDI